MPNTFDAAMKELIRARPADWVAFLGFPVRQLVEVLSADLSTVSASADTLVRAGDVVLHIEFQGGPDDRLADRMLMYNVPARYHTGLSVHSVVFLLRPEADRTNLGDPVEYSGDPARGGLAFRYEVVRVWDVPAADFLRGHVGLLPLAVLGRPPEGRTRLQALPDIVRGIARRADGETPAVAGDLLMSSLLLSGMRVDHTLAKEIFRMALSIHDNPVYLGIMQEGAVEHAHKMLLLLGRERFGEPTPGQERRLKAIQDMERLDRMILRVLRVSSWDQLLRGR
jgi:hypothetical protein